MKYEDKTLKYLIEDFSSHWKQGDSSQERCKHSLKHFSFLESVLTVAKVINQNWCGIGSNGLATCRSGIVIAGSTWSSYIWQAISVLKVVGSHKSIVSCLAVHCNKTSSRVDRDKISRICRYESGSLVIQIVDVGTAISCGALTGRCTKGASRTAWAWSACSVCHSWDGCCVVCHLINK